MPERILSLLRVEMARHAKQLGYVSVPMQKCGIYPAFQTFKDRARPRAFVSMPQVSTEVNVLRRVFTPRRIVLWSRQVWTDLWADLSCERPEFWWLWYRAWVSDSNEKYDKNLRKTWKWAQGLTWGFQRTLQGLTGLIVRKSSAQPKPPGTSRLAPINAFPLCPNHRPNALLQLRPRIFPHERAAILGQKTPPTNDENQALAKGALRQ